jgi:hypothetical protein
MTCRDEILACAKKEIQRTGINEFTLQQIVKLMNLSGTNYKESSIRTHVSSLMCVNSPNHHGKKHHDFERISHGLYRLINKS